MDHKNYLVYIIEDDEVTRGLIKKKLELIQNLTMKEFSSVESALNKISAEPDFYIVDHFLEKENGIDCIPILREFTPNAKIIVLSSQEDVNVLEKAFVLGADYYFLKNINGITSAISQVQSCVLEKEITKDKKLKRWYELFISSKNKIIKPRSIYILEDNSNTAFALEFSLGHDTLRQVTAFTNSNDFITKFEDKKPDIIILDYDLQEEVTGLDLLKKIKRDSPQTKVIMLSAQKDIEVASNVLKAGAIYYMVKSKDAIVRLKAIVNNLDE